MKDMIKSKTFWTGAASGVGGWASGAMDSQAAMQLIIGGLSAIFLRDAVRKGR
jgi:hypothetical protein